jgi:hypothetical protein
MLISGSRLPLSCCESSPLELLVDHMQRLPYTYAPTGRYRPKVYKSSTPLILTIRPLDSLVHGRTVRHLT